MLKKALKPRWALALLVVIILTLAMVVPVLADGPPDHQHPENKKGERGEQNETRQQQAGQPEQPGQGKAQPDKASSHDNQGQGRSNQSDSPGNQGQGKAQPDKASSHDNQGRSNQPDSSGNPGQGKAQPDKASSHDNQGRSNQPESPGNQGQGKAQRDRASSQDNQGQGRSNQPESPGNQGRIEPHLDQTGAHGDQGQGKATPKQWVDTERPGPAKTQMGRSRLQADQAHGPGAAFTPSSDACNLYRYRGKPEPKPFDISQGESVVAISNTGGLKNLRITVNGRRFRVPLDNQAVPIRVDVSSALVSSKRNNIVFLTALGKPDTCAWVVIGR